MDKIKKLSISTLFLLVFISSFQLFIFADVFEINMTTEHISDEDRMLEQSEISALESRIQIINEKYGAEHIVVLNKNRDWSEIRGRKNYFAKSVYIEKEFGFGTDNTGSILLVDFFPPPGDRDIEVVTFGRIVKEFQPKVDGVISDIGYDFSEGRIYEGVNHYLDVLEDYHITRGTIDENGNFVGISLKDKFFIQLKNPYLLIGAFVAAVILTLIPFVNYQGSNDITPYTYEHQGDFSLIDRRDVFSHSHTTQTRIPKSTSSSIGGGGTGGGSGKF